MLNWKWRFHYVFPFFNSAVGQWNSGSGWRHSHWSTGVSLQVSHQGCLCLKVGKKYPECMHVHNEVVGSIMEWHLVCYKNPCYFMMTSSNGNIFRVTGHLCGEFTGHRWIPHTKASDAELWCFLWSAPEWTAKHTIGRLVVWNAIAPIMTSL